MDNPVQRSPSLPPPPDRADDAGELLDQQGTPLWVDLGCPEFLLAVEYDGGYQLTPEQQHADALRNERTLNAGWRQLVRVICGRFRRGTLRRHAKMPPVPR